MSLSGQELSQWHQHRHLSLPAVQRPVTFVLENMHNLEPLLPSTGECYTLLSFKGSNVNTFF